MGFLSFLLLGLIVGAIAKAILPDRHYGGCFTTMLLGVIGSMVGGGLGVILFDAPLENFFSIQTWILAIAGSILVLFIWGAMTGRNRR